MELGLSLNIIQQVINGYTPAAAFFNFSQAIYKVDVLYKCTSIQMFLPPAHFWKTAGVIVLGSVAVSAVTAECADVSPYILVAIKARFLKLGMCNICKTNIAKMFLDFF